MKEMELAAAFAIARAKSRGLAEVGPDELLLGALQAVSRFGVVQLGPTLLDLEELGLDWMERSKPTADKPSYSASAVALFDLAAQIAKSDGVKAIGLDHLLVAFANEDSGLMRDLKRRYGISGAGWRAVVAQLAFAAVEAPTPVPEEKAEAVLVASRDYLTPEEAAEALGIHVQTLRGYVRSGKLPALRLAGERAIRIRRTDLEAVLEPLVSAQNVN